MAKSQSFDEISEIIVDAIISEPIFSKEILQPRIKALLKAFHFKSSSIPNIDNELTATEKHKILLRMQQKEHEVLFWKQKCQLHLPDYVEIFYEELNTIRE